MPRTEPEVGATKLAFQPPPGGLSRPICGSQKTISTANGQPTPPDHILPFPP